MSTTPAPLVTASTASGIINSNNSNEWVITWNAVGDAGWHDVLVKGDSPFGDIAFY
jgi:hypothetical protein